MINIRLLILFLLSSYGFFSISCKKDSDTSPPQIEALLPAVHSIHNTFDTINVKANIIDDQELTFVSVELLNADLISVVTPYSKTLSTKEYRLNASIIVDNIQLTSGIHYILITAKDKENTTRSFTEVVVNGLPIETRGYVTFENIFTQFEVHRYFNGSDSILYQSQGEVVGGVVDSYHQQLGVLRGPDGPFETHPLFPFINEWEVGNIHGGISFCRGQADKLFIQLGFTDQILSFYQGEGALKRNFTSDINHKPLYSLDHDENIIVWQKAPGQGSDRLEVFFPSGALKQITSYNHTVVDLEIKDENKIFVISNDENDAHYDIYNLENGEIQELMIAGEHFKSACTDNIGRLYIAGMNGVYRYDPISLQLATILSISANKLEWDLNLDLLIASTDDQLIVFNSLGMELESYTLTGESVELGVWYSK